MTQITAGLSVLLFVCLFVCLSLCLSMWYVSLCLTDGAAGSIAEIVMIAPPILPYLHKLTSLVLPLATENPPLDD